MTISDRASEVIMPESKERPLQARSSKNEKLGETDKKKRLAAALRRNLAKRKDTKEAKTVDNPERD